ncbi:MAG: alpha-galactosidase [Spirochaetaceae bacterium]|jgi:alpha-galactosidase|nr:alpha-galactosidase [Spirochaetaceae bacterium]
MSITFIQKDQVFHLQTPTSSYIMSILQNRYLSHVGWYQRIKNWNGANNLSYKDRSFSPNPQGSDFGFSLDNVPQEYPTAGRSDFRNPAIEVVLPGESTALDLWYKSHRIFAGKPKLEGLPATYIESGNEADTLEIELYDPVSLLSVTLSYTVWHDRDVISRSTKVTNSGKSAITLKKGMSASIDFEGSDYKLLQLSGAHCRERHPYFRKLSPGLQGIESRRGASSHQQNPFIALMASEATEDHGEVFGFNLVYSGNFSILVEVDQFSSSRLSAGINPFNFQWILEPGLSFQSPELVMVRSNTGLGGMSRTYHDLYRERLCRGSYRDRERPVVINNWEATYFDFNEEKLLALAEEAGHSGIDMFVLDDGWFGKRNDDKSSLGDWFLNKKKLPRGLKDLGNKIISKGLTFGLWVEPEMISPDSELYRTNPLWCLHVKDREGSLGRNQLVLDLSREDVRKYIITTMTNIFNSAPISYVKWDMNRHMTEVESAIISPEKQQEVSHRYILGLYDILEKLTGEFPDILFESCSGGGGRYDPGMLYYMPQVWTSDNTDALSRVWIQLGTSIVYPASTMACHVSAVPNHQVGRTTPLSMRGNIAMSGAFGYELDMTKVSSEEKKEIAEQVARYKEISKTVLFGDMYRLCNPWNNLSFSAWMIVSKDKAEAVVTCVWLYTEANDSWIILRLKGLDPDRKYLIKGMNNSYGGDELMSVGIRMPHGPECENSIQYHLIRES